MCLSVCLYVCMVYHTRKLQTNEIGLHGNANIHMKIYYKNMEIKVVYKSVYVRQSSKKKEIYF